MLRLFVISIAILGEALASPTDGTLYLNQYDPCPHMPNYPESRCLRSCPHIKELIEKQFITAAVKCHVDSICCPTAALQSEGTSSTNSVDSVPLFPKVRSNSNTAYNFTFPPLAELYYLTSDLDEHQYRCTALLVRENYVLTSAGCVSSNTQGRPEQVCFGNCHRLLKAEKKKISFEISHALKHRYNNDLSLLNFDIGLNSSEIPVICNKRDLEHASRLIAVGFPRKEDNCDLFQENIEIMPFEHCQNLENNFKVEGIDGDKDTHFCARPIKMKKNVRGSCVRCLRGSASVLFAIQSDKSYCALGIATPTISSCYYSTAVLYYTSLMNPDVTNFIQSAN